MTGEVLLESDFSDEKDVVEVKGYIAHEGVMNRQTFTKEELNKAAESFIGRPIMKEHTRAVDEVVGRITAVQYQFDEKKQKHGIAYKGEIGKEHDKLINDIKRQFVSGVSMRIGYDKKPTHYCNICGSEIGKCSHDFSNPDFAPVATNFYGKHLAIVTEPADRQASISMSFDDDGQVYNDIEEFLRRTKMSDFEEKYTDLVEEFSQFKLNHQDEIAKLEEDFKAQKEGLEADMAEKVNEYITLKADFDAISAEKEELESKVKSLEAEFAKIEEEKLSSLRKEVSALNQEVYGNLTEEQINSFEESTLKHYIGLFSHQNEKMPSVGQNVDTHKPYEGDFEEKDPADTLLARIQ